MPGDIKARLFNLKVGQVNDNKLIFSVSKKVDKRATRRNKLRRLFKASLQNLLGKSSHPNFLFIIKKEAIKIPQKEIESELEKVLKKEKLIK
jgi:ribonuclease P protein component